MGVICGLREPNFGGTKREMSFVVYLKVINS